MGGRELWTHRGPYSTYSSAGARATSLRNRWVLGTLNSHQPTRQREQRMQRFKSPGHAQQFLSAYGPIAQHFRFHRYRFTAPAYHQELKERFQLWRGITILTQAA